MHVTEVCSAITFFCINYPLTRGPCCGCCAALQWGEFNRYVVNCGSLSTKCNGQMCLLATGESQVYLYHSS
jgi:hypothetical protein